MIWISFLAESILLLLTIWLCIIIVKLLLIKGYRDYPPFVPTFGQTKKVEYQKLFETLSNSSNKLIILDPGCGTADMIIRLAKQFPLHQFIGIEWNRSLYKIACFRARNLKNLTLRCQDMFDYSFEDADIIVCFLMEPLMKHFGEKVLREGKKDALIYSNTFAIPNLTLKEEIKTRKFFIFGNVFVYKI